METKERIAKRQFDRMIIHAIAIVLLYGAALSAIAQAESQKNDHEELEVKTLSDADKREVKDRNVDKAALAAQQVAIKKIEGLLKKYRGRRQEPVLLERLAEIYQQDAAIRSRIAHADAHRKNNKIKLTEFKRALTKSISTLDQLIGKYPSYPTIERAWFLRGKAHEDIGNIALAEQNYLVLVRKYPESSDLPSAYMSLANFAIDSNRHALAVQYLEEIEKRPWVPHYPFALYKLAWAHYNLRAIPKGLNYLKQHISLINQKAKEDGVMTTADRSMRESSLRDVTLFYLDGFELKIGEYTVENALPYFKKLEDGPFLGDMLLKFAKLLRAHNHEQAMMQWKEIILDREISRPETIDIVLNVFDYQVQARQFEPMINTSRDFIRIYKATFPHIVKTEEYKRVQAKLLETAETLQKWTIKNKKAQAVNRLSNTLASIYDTFTRIVDEADPRIPGAHYNLAETLFKIKDYAGATGHYRWIVQNGDRSKGKKIISVEDASLKAIASLYEVLLDQKMVPRKLDARHLQEDKSGDPPKLLAEWVDWIDTHQKTYEKSSPELENFEFEANRALYAHGKIIPALLRMIRFAKRIPQSKYAKPSASLVLDTYVKSEKWESAHELSERFKEFKPWQKSQDQKFNEQLYKVASDSFFKMVEDLYKNKEYEKTLSKSDEFLDQYVASDKYQDALYLSGQSALKMGDENKASNYLSRLIDKFPKSENTPPALLARSQILEKRYLFARASLDYQSYLGSLPVLKEQPSGGELNKLRKKILWLTWLSGNYPVLGKMIADPHICTPHLSLDCEQYQALVFINDAKSLDKKHQLSDKDIFKRSLSGEKDLRPLWAIAAMENQQELRFPDRLLLVRIISGRWDNIDPIVQFSLIGRVSQSIPLAFQLNSKAMKIYARLKADEKSIGRRVKLMEEMEQSATGIVKNMPWSRVRASVLNEVAQLYLDFSGELSTLQAPTGLKDNEIAEYQGMIQKIVLPFEEKGFEIKRKAFEIASTFAVEDEVFFPIAKSFFKDNPSQAKTLMGEVNLKHRIPLDRNILVKLDPNGDWHEAFRDVNYSADKQALYLKYRWAEAMDKQNWPLIAYLIQEGKEKDLMKNSTLGLVRGISFAAAGARGEGLIEVANVRNQLEPLEKSRTNLLLITQYANSLSREKTKSYVEEIKSDNLVGRVTRTQDEAFLLAYAADWSETQLEANEKRDLLNKAKKASLEDYRAWARKRLSEIGKDPVQSAQAY